MDDMKTGDRYMYKGKTYEIVGFDGLKMKDADDGNWSPGLITNVQPGALPARAAERLAQRPSLRATGIMPPPPCWRRMRATYHRRA